MANIRPRCRDAERFKENLRKLYRLRDWTQAEAAARLQVQGVPRKWFERICRQGLVHLPKANTAAFKRLRVILKTFGLDPKRPQQLWQPGLAPKPDDFDAKLWADFERRVELLRELVTEHPTKPQIQKVFRHIEVAHSSAVRGAVGQYDRRQARRSLRIDRIRQLVCAREERCSTAPGLDAEIGKRIAANPSRSDADLAELVLEQWSDNRLTGDSPWLQYAKDKVSELGR